MKKLFIAVLVTFIGLAFTAPSFAIEHEFGGHWYVRMFSMKDFSGNDSGSMDEAIADTETRLFYTATINDNLKLVNAFEMDAVWGDSTKFGDIGSDGVDVEVKHTYADFNVGALNAKVGTQETVIQRGFIFYDDFSGVVLSFGDLTAKYIKEEENGDDADDDVSIYNLAYTVDLDTVKLTPVFTYKDMASDDKVWWAGLDVDAVLGRTSLWGTFIYNDGETGTLDVKAWLAAAGGTFKLTDTFDIHGQAFYSTGDDDNADKDQEQFQTIGIDGWTGTSYYWSEIMGYGLIDWDVSNNSPADSITNIMAVNLGVTFAPMEKLSLSADLWYAEVAEELTPGLDEELGFEIDLRATYELVDGLNLDVIGAYLFAGDSTTNDAPDDENPWEVGTQLSLSF